MKLKITGSSKQKNRFLTDIEYIEGMEFYPEGKGGQLGDLGSVGGTGFRGRQGRETFFRQRDDSGGIPI